MGLIEKKAATACRASFRMPRGAGIAPETRAARAAIPRALVLALVLWLAVARAEDVVSHPFRGVTILQRSVTGPPREAIFVAELDLKEPTLRFTTTEPNGEAPRDTNTETVLDFVTRKKAQLGINANFFDFDKASATDVRGLAVSEGRLVSPWEKHDNALNISEKNEATFVHRLGDDFKGTETRPPVKLYNTVCGGMMLVEEGKNVAHGDGKRHPRTCVGLKPKQVLLLVVVDGRHPDHSEGMTHEELADTLISLGAVEGMELDGGGSATFVVADPTPTVLNVAMSAPVPAGIQIPPPGLLRANGFNLAVFAKK